MLVQKGKKIFYCLSEGNHGFL
uniref:Uncharacterized protein n=1 Tax=Arundo donax TaxID=35708 RepID=A0A0A9FDA9_ARUDO